jgi:hypothetical protein
MKKESPKNYTLKQMISLLTSFSNYDAKSIRKNKLFKEEVSRRNGVRI